MPGRVYIFRIGQMQGTFLCIFFFIQNKTVEVQKFQSNFLHHKLNIFAHIYDVFTKQLILFICAKNNMKIFHQTKVPSISNISVKTFGMDFRLIRKVKQAHIRLYLPNGLKGVKKIKYKNRISLERGAKGDSISLKKIHMPFFRFISTKRIFCFRTASFCFS